MNKFFLHFFISIRYLFTRKSYAIINIISSISVIGVMVGTMALIVVLSVFNGFEELILRFFNNFHADFKIESTEGKTINTTVFPYHSIREAEQVKTITYVIEDLALARYDNKQHLVYVKAVTNDYLLSGNIDSIIIRGEAVLEHNGNEFAILGAGVDYILGINPNDYTKAISLYTPKRKAKPGVLLHQAFVSETVMPGAVFSVQHEYDETYIIIPFETGKRLYDYNNEVTSVEIMLKKGSDIKKSRKELETILGNRFIIKDRQQQQEFLYKILKSEKFAIILILSFILIIATFNVIGTLTMIILEKRENIAVFNAIGAPLKFIRRLFVVKGMLIVAFGSLLGIILGIILCLLQQKYGLLRLTSHGADFVIQNYPVKMKATDLLIVLATVYVIGFISAIIPAKRINEDMASLKPTAGK